MTFDQWGWRSVVLVPLALLAACATTGGSAERTRQLEERVDRLETEGAAPRSDADRAAAREQAQRVDARLSALESKVAEASAAAQRNAKGGTGDGAAQAKTDEELAKLRKQLDEQGRKLDAMEQRLARAQADAGEKRAAASSTPASRSRSARAPAEKSRSTAAASSAPSPGPAAVAAPAAAAAAASSSTGNQAEVLALARQQEASGQREVARDLYEEYVRKFPSDPGAAEARFRLGELAFADKRYQDAIVEYGKVARDYSRSERAPDALLRTADSMLAAGMKDEAKVVLADIPRRYPSSPAAARAKQRLSDLGGPEKPAKP